MSETYAELEREIAVAQNEMEEARQKLVKLRRQLAPKPVKD